MQDKGRYDECHGLLCTAQLSMLQRNSDQSTTLGRLRLDSYKLDTKKLDTLLRKTHMIAAGNTHTNKYTFITYSQSSTLYNKVSFGLRVFNDHIDICDIKYLPKMNQKDHRITYRSMPLMDKFDYGLFSICVQICDIICNIFR